jgi:cytochrome P450
VYRWMLEEAPVFYSEKWNWWAFSRFEDVRAAATDHDTFLSFEGIDIDATATDQSGPGFLPDIDNPRHDQLRKIVQPHFLPRRIAKHELHVREVIHEFIRGWKDRDEIDIAQELSWPAPMEIFFDLIGLPSAREAGRADLERWVHELKDRNPGDDRLTPLAIAATEGIRNYFVELLNERRRNPRQDLITHIVQAEIDGVPLADEMTIRGFAMGVAIFALWTANTIISFVFPILAESLGSTGTFAIFVVINALAWLFTYKYVPETRGRSLEELEDDFRTHDAAHFTHTAPAGVHGS